MITGFTDHAVTLDGVEVAYSIGGSGPPILLLHGFPQTRKMWAHVAPVLAQSHTVICADLRGYGDSGKPTGVENYSFRNMARDQLALMRHLGFERFDLAGHDRGARVAHRLTLDAPDAINRLCLMDIIPTHTLLDDLRRDVAQAYYHWFFLAQPEPFPETLIGYDPDTYYQSCLLGWGGSTLEDFDARQLETYREAWRNPQTIRAMCDDYRAALIHDFNDDAADLGTRIPCPTLILFGASGAMAQAYDVPGIWASRCTDMQALTIPGGHFFVDTAPGETATALAGFFAQP